MNFPKKEDEFHDPSSYGQSLSWYVALSLCTNFHLDHITFLYVVWLLGSRTHAHMQLCALSFIEVKYESENKRLANTKVSSRS
jgi:hypothetical protein